MSSIKGLQEGNETIPSNNNETTKETSAKLKNNARDVRNIKENNLLKIPKNKENIQTRGLKNKRYNLTKSSKNKEETLKYKEMKPTRSYKNKENLSKTLKNEQNNLPSYKNEQISQGKSVVNKSDSNKDLHNYVKILQTFPILHPIVLRKMFERCDRDFCRTIDNILYLKRYCYFLNKVRKFKLVVSKEQIQNNSNKNNITMSKKAESTAISQVQNYRDQSNFAPAQHSDTSEMQVHNYINQNNFSSAQYYSANSGIEEQNYGNQNIPINSNTYDTQKNTVAYPVALYPNYFNNTSSTNSNYLYSVSNNTSYENSNYSYPFSYDTSINNQVNLFYNSQDINTTNSSNYCDSSNPSDVYVPNGSVEGISIQLNNFIDETSFTSQFNDSFSNNYLGNFRTSTPELRDESDF